MAELLTAGEAGRLLKLHPRTVTRLANAGMLCGMKVAGQWRFSPADLDGYLKRCRVANVDPEKPMGEGVEQ